MAVVFAKDIFDNDLHRNFFEKIAEKFSRGDDQALSHIAIFEALHNPEGDLQGAIDLRNKVRSKELLDPIQSNFFTKFVYGAAQTAGQMWEATKASIPGALGGAGVGAATAAILGQAGPQAAAPEEILTVPGAAAYGAKIGATEAAAWFSYKEGTGAMYADLLDQGISPDIAYKASHIAGVPYALIEVAQLKAAAPSVKTAAKEAIERGTQSVIKKFVKTYGKNLTKEVFEEMAQEIVQIGAEEAAKVAEGQDVKIDRDFLLSKSRRVLEVGKQATEAFALIPLPGSAIESGLAVSMKEVNAELADNIQRDFELKPEDVATPLEKVRVALDNAANVYVEQEVLRKQERKERAGLAAEERESPDKAEYWSAAAKKQLADKYSEFNVKPLSEDVPMEVFEQLSQEIRSATDKLNVYEAINLNDSMKELFEKGTLLRPFEQKLAGKMWGQDFQRQLEAMSELAKKDKAALDVFLDYIQLPKATLASSDISRTLRQNILLIGSPKQWGKAFARDVKLFAKDEQTALAMEKDMIIRLAEAGDLRKYIRWNNWGDKATAKTSSEAFQSRFTGKLPLLRRSERAYSSGGNLLRGELMLKYANKWRKAGKTLTNKQLKDLGHVIDVLTGEGDARALGKLAPFLNAVFFAPRLLEARIRAFTDLFNPNLSWAARKVLAYHVVSFVGTNLGILGLMSLVPGVNVERDWRSTDFGKIKIGDTRIDFWGGYLPLARLVTRLATGEIKTQSGRIIPVDIKDTLASFLQSKLGPIPAYALDLIRGQTFYGDYVGVDTDSIVEQFYERFTPLIFQDVVDAVRFQGLNAAYIAAPLTFLGAGVQTYPKTESTKALLYKNQLALQTVGEKWDNLSPAVQKYLRQEFPEIEQQERQINYQRTNYEFLNKLALEKQRVQDKFYKALPEKVREELDSLSMKPAGISRSISNGWYLNDKRYKEYQETTLKLYKEFLPALISMPNWDRIPPNYKVMLFDRVMKEVKEAARKKIVNSATVEDLRRVSNQ